MTLSASIVSYFDSSMDANAVTLRTLVGVDHLWAGEVPIRTTSDAPLTIPYVALHEISEVPFSEGKDNSYRIDTAVIQFDAFDLKKSSVDAILEALENAYLDAVLTVSNRNTLGKPRKRNRFNLKEENEDLWHGVLELAWLLEKQPE